MKRILLLAVLPLLLFACGRKGSALQEEPERGVYYWKTDFVITPSDSAFLHQHGIGRIYLRFFDVVLANKAITGHLGVVPNATVSFSSSVPPDIEIVPVVYVTLDALKDITYSGGVEDAADKICRRIEAMCTAHGVAPIQEIQLDCDYTDRTRDGYFALCSSLRQILSRKGIRLSSTLRLHQLRDAAPPVDAVSLMLYNTDNFRNPDVENSILNPATVKAYLKGGYPLPVSVALPVYGWGIWMRDGVFRTILHQTDYGDTLLYRKGERHRYTVLRDHIVDNHEIKAGDVIRLETSPIDIVSEVRRYALERVPARGIILYHLDSLNLSSYSFEEIENLYTHANH